MPSLDPQSEPPERPEPGGRPSAWGPLATVGLSILVLLVFLAVQALVTVGLSGLERPAPATVPDPGPAPQWDGWLMSLGLLASAPIAIGLIAWLARRRGGIRPQLALEPASARSLIGWIVAVVAFIVLSDWITHRLHQPVVPDFMLEAYRTAGLLPLFWLAVVVAAPAFEEALFRGFLFSGLERSRLGGLGAVIATALAWTLLHMQYQLFHLMIVFGAGVLLGLARWRSGSLYVPLAMHVVWNTIATAQVAFGMGG